MNIIASDHSQSGCVLADTAIAAQKTECQIQPVVNLSPLDASPISCTYVHVQYPGTRHTILCYFSNNLFFDIDEQRALDKSNIICWKPAFNEGFHAIA